MVNYLGDRDSKESNKTVKLIYCNITIDLLLENICEKKMLLTLREIWTIFFRKLLTDKNPQHGLSEMPSHGVVSRNAIININIR